MQRKIARIKKFVAETSYRYGITDFLQNDKNRKRIEAIFAAAILLSGAVLVKGLGGGKKYIMDHHGNVTGVYRENPEASASYPMRVIIKGKGGQKNEDLVLTIRSKKKEVREKKKKNDYSKEEQERLFSQMLMSLQQCSGKVIRLPSRLENGAVIRWNRSRNVKPILILFLPFTLTLFLYQQERQKKRERRKLIRDSVVRELPGFNDQILMLMGAGLIFRDAFWRICQGYSRKRENPNIFEKEMLEILERTDRNHTTVAKEVERKAEELNITEFSRFSGIISDNQIRGTDLTEKLMQESRFLWEQRKKLAEERGKLAETKLTLPLAVLLIVLIVVTAGPALLQIQGG